MVDYIMRKDDKSRVHVFVFLINSHYIKNMKKDVLIIPDGRSEEKFTVKGSRFIGVAMPAQDPEDAKSRIKSLWNVHPSATHIVYAFMTGGRVRELSGFSDDGEPHGTAGRPVMEVVKGSGIKDVLVCVIRYYGGTKLGTGGLVQAYTKAAQLAIESLPIKKLIPRQEYDIRVEYSLYEPLKVFFVKYKVEVLHEEFSSDVTLKISVPKKHIEDVSDYLKNISHGKIIL